MNAFSQLRTAAGLTREQVSEILEVPASVVVAYEAGAERPSARELQILRGLSYGANVSSPNAGATSSKTDSEQTPFNKSEEREAFAPSAAPQGTTTTATFALPHPIDRARLIASNELDPGNRAVLGQFMTPSAIADYMASLFQRWPRQVKLPDPGAGIGSLTEAFVAEWLRRAPARSEIELTTYEIEPVLLSFLGSHLNKLVDRIGHAHRKANVEIVPRDFIAEAAFAVSLGGPRFTHVILNPPYRKISATSEYRRLLSSVGIETGNLYAAFLALAIGLCERGGEVVAIIPRSFCNGAYFRPFRKWLLARAAITHIHVFESRKKAFQDDNVLQENIIIRLSPVGSRSGT